MFCVHYYDVSAKIMTQETLRKYINGDASDEERLEVLHWVEESEDNRKELMAYRNLSNALIFNCDLERKTTLNERGKKRRAVIFRRAVEAIGVAAAIALGVFFGFRHHETDTPIAVETLSAPAGLITESILSDGTRICLNAGSKLEIINYKKNERRVRLYGEAYFDVSRDEKRPFIVETDKIAVRVLGTEFDVNSKGDEHSVVLVRGAVQVDSQTDAETLTYRLVPGQRFLRNPSDGSGNITQVTTEYYTSWINGYLKFEKLPVEQVILKIQDYYGICIRHDGLAQDAYPITGKLDLRTRVDTALVNLEFLAPVNFEKISDNEYRVTMK